MALELQFEHIDWNDIVDAELSGDASKLESLRCKSEELKRSFSLPTPPSHTPPPPSPPSHSSPTSSRDTGCFKVPRKLRGANRPNLRSRPLAKQNTSLPFENWDQEYPILPSSQSTPALPQCTSPVAENYAMVLSKRSFSDRNCVSPVECAAKRSALAGLVPSPPSTGGEGLGAFNFSTLTPKEFGVSSSQQQEEEGWQYATPENDSRPAKATAGAVQRRLFPMAGENASQRRGSSSSSVSSDTAKELTSLQVAKRQKQIDYGKNTHGYQRYVQEVPKWQRKRKQHPATPDKTEAISTRCWQGRIKVWRRALHSYDPPNEQGLTHFTAEEAALCDLDMNCDVH